MKAIAALLTVLVLAGCTTSTLQDLEGVHAAEPELIQVYYSPNWFPNLMVTCPEGRESYGVLITTRDYQDPILFDRCPLSGERGDVITIEDAAE
jgi:hypothetical protein